MEKIFGFDEDFVRRQFEPREVKCDSNNPVFPNQNFLESCLEEAKELTKDKEAQTIFRKALGDGSEI